MPKYSLGAKMVLIGIFLYAAYAGSALQKAYLENIDWLSDIDSVEQAAQTFTSPPTILNATADITVRQSVTTNGNNNAEYAISNGGGGLRQVYVKFNLANLGGSISSAKLRVYVTNDDARPITVSAVADDSWQETSMVWSNKPALTSPALGTIDVSSQYLNNLSPGLDVTSFIASQAAGDRVASFAFSYPTSPGYAAVGRREDGRAATLEITYISTTGGSGAQTTQSTQATTPTPSPSALAAAPGDLIFSTYLSGSGDEMARDVAYDRQGNIYVTGGTISANFPTTAGAFDTTANGNWDVFLTKFDPTGQIIWSTYLGGPNYDRAYALEVVDNGGSSDGVYLAGRSGVGFPTTFGPAFLNQNINGPGYDSVPYGQQNAFLAKFTLDGQRVWSRYNQKSPDEVGLFRDIALDSSGNIYGVTTAYGVFKFDSTGANVWDIPLKGNGTTLFNVPSVRVDSANNIYVSGGTNSTSGLVVGGYQSTNTGIDTDIYLAKINPSGSVIWGTYVGGAGNEAGETHNLAVDGQNVYLAAYTNSSSGVVASGGYDTTYSAGTDAFIVKVSSIGQLLASTYLGGSANETLEGVNVDSSGYVYVTGSTASANFPMTADAYDSSHNTARDFYVAKLTNDLSGLVYSTFLGSSLADDARASAIGPDNSLTVVGHTASGNGFPVLNATNMTHGGEDGVVAKFNLTAYTSIIPPPPPSPVDSPPTITITNPLNGTTVNPNTNVNFAANATDDNGITQVTFLDGSQILGVDTTAPYSAVWNTTGLVGVRNLSATAMDTAGQITPAFSSVNVSSPPPSPSSACTQDLQNIASRCSGVEPLGVFFDATNLTYGGVVRPFHDLEFEWNFGDPTSGNWSTNGKSKNVAYGAVAAHVFENIGPHTVTLRVKNNGNIIDTKSETINVFAFESQTGAQTYCLSNAGTDTSCGPVGSTIAGNNFDAAINWLKQGNPRRILIKRGETFSNATSFGGGNNLTRGTISTYGTGSKPVINATWTGVTSTGIGFNGTGLVVQDIVYQGRYDIANTPTIVTQYDAFTLAGTDILLDGVEIRGFARGIGASGSGVRNRIILQDSLTENFKDYNIYATGNNLAMLGNRFGNSYHEAMTRFPYATKSVFQHNIFNFSSGGDRGRPWFRLHGGDGTQALRSQYDIISDNQFARAPLASSIHPTGLAGGDIVIGPGNGGTPPAQELVDDVVFERNKVTIDSKEYVMNALGICTMNNLTVRNNIAHGPFHAFLGLCSHTYPGWNRGITQIDVFNNSFYASGTSAPTSENPRFAEVGTMGLGPTTYNFRNNISYAPNSTQAAIVNRDANVTVREFNNIWFNSASPVNQNPKLIDAPNGNLYLQPNSPAIDTGSVVPLWSDYLGTVRPLGAAYDIGAYEYTGPVTTYTISASAGVGGSIFPSGQVSVNSGASQTFNFSPDSGYQVATVVVNGNTLTNPGSSYTFNNVISNGQTINVTFTNAPPVPDTTAPTVSWLNPNSNLTVSGSVTLQASAQDNIGGSGMAGIQFKNDNQNLGSFSATAPYSANWDTANLAYGPHTINAVARDNVGNYATTTLSLSVDNGAPFVISAMTSTIFTPPTPAILAVTAADLTGPVTCRFSPISNTPFAQMPIANTMTANGITHGYNFGTLLPMGSYTYYVKCQDVANPPNANAQDLIITFDVGSVNPTTHTITATAGANGSISPTGATAVNAGANQTFIFTPNSGYQVASVTVDGVAVAVANSYTFTNVQAGHTINVTFDLLPPPINSAPIANAGSDQTHMLIFGQNTITVTLDGSASTDSDGTISSYVWTGTPDPADQVSTQVSLTAGTYTFILTVTDNDGKQSSDQVMITINPYIAVDNVPPEITNITDSTFPAPTSAVVVSVTTNEVATCRIGSADVAYDLLPINSMTLGAVVDGAYPHQSSSIFGLVPGSSVTRYVRCQDELGNANQSGLLVSFNVLGDTTLPIVTIYNQVDGSTVSGVIPLMVNASDDVAVVGVTFKLDNINLAPEDVFAPYFVTWDTTNFPDGQYQVSATARDAAGNFNSHSINLRVNNSLPPADNTPPIISGLVVSNVTTNSARISFTTNEVADSSIYYGVTSVYGTSQDIGTTTTSHVFDLTNLTPNNIYHYYVSAVDYFGNAVVGQDNTFATEALPAGGGGGGGGGSDSQAPDEVTFASAVGTDRQVIITWMNPDDSDYVKTLIARKTTAFPSNISNPRNISGATIVYDGINAQFIDTNLNNGQIYYYALFTYDEVPNYSEPVILQAVPTAGGQGNQLASASTGGAAAPLDSGSALANTTIVLPSVVGPFAIGSTGAQVTILQQMLTLGNYYTGTPSGVYDNATVLAVQAFQRANGIVSSGTPQTTGYGLAGPSTRLALNRLYSGKVLTIAGFSLPNLTNYQSLTLEQKEAVLNTLRAIIVELQKTIIALLQRLLLTLQNR